MIIRSKAHCDVFEISVGAVLEVIIDIPCADGCAGITNEGGGIGFIKNGGCNSAVKQAVFNGNIMPSTMMNKTTGLTAILVRIKDVGRYADSINRQAYNIRNTIHGSNHKTCRIRATNLTRYMDIMNRRVLDASERGGFVKLRLIDITIDSVTIAVEFADKITV